MTAGLACLVTFPAAGVATATATATAPARPAVRSVAPMQAGIGDRLTIRGRHFLPGKRRNTVFFKVAGKPPVSVKAEQATPTKLKVTIPRSLERRLGTRPTRVRLRVRARRLGRSYTSARRSPAIRGARAAAIDSARQPCLGLDCVPADAAAAPGADAAPPPTSTLVFHDDFEGDTVDTAKWSPYTSPGHAGNGLRRPSAFAQENGRLVVTGAWDGTNIVSGGMSHRFTQLYGSYEVRVRIDPDPSGQMSGVVLTWPQSGRQVPDGEIDIWETQHFTTRNPWWTFIHRSRDGVTDSQTWLRHDSDAAQWHTVRMDWTPDAIRIYVDGELDGQITDPARIPDKPHYLCVQLDAFSNRPLQAPVRMYVDWVKVYSAPAA